MKLPLTLAAALAGLGLLAAAESAMAADQSTPPSAGQGAKACFRSGDITGVNAPDRNTVYLRIGVKDVFEIKLLIPCDELRFNEQIGIQSTGGLDLICSGLDATVVSPTDIGPQYCPAKSVRKLSPDEIAALPKKDLP